MPLNPNLVQNAVRSLSGSVSQMRRDNLAVETALQVLIDQGIFNPTDPFTVPDGVVVDKNGFVDQTSYTWRQVAECCLALYSAATDLNTLPIMGEGSTLRKVAINRLVGL